MMYELNYEKADHLLQDLKEKYRIYAPKRLARHGWKTGSDLIRYGEITSFNEIVHDEQSHFSPKDVISPMVQTMMYFTDDKCVESEIDDKGILLFARPCDINGIKRLDKIFLENGGTEDLYYKRMREKLRIIMLECREGWENCFCVSMGTNKSDSYDIAVRFEDNKILAEVKADDFKDYFVNLPQTDASPEFVTENKVKVTLPQINREHLSEVIALPMWQEFNEKCASCGSCNTVCITCSCFDTTDIVYNETSPDGERRRIWSSCMLENFSTMAGGHSVRKTAGDRMRFKTLHKVFDYNLRFGGEDNMCVGCGRCDIRCPKDISFRDTINRLHDEMENLNNG
jgi:anaerobic sulfite reductase subunit A